MYITEYKLIRYCLCIISTRVDKLCRSCVILQKPAHIYDAVRDKRYRNPAICPPDLVFVQEIFV